MIQNLTEQDKANMFYRDRGYNNAAISAYAGYTMFFLLPLIMLVASIGETVHSAYLLQTGIKADSEVVRIIKRGAGATHRHSTYTPIIQYVTQDNQIISARAETASSSHTDLYTTDYKVGDKIPIVYSSSNPHSFKVLTFFGLWNWLVFGIPVSLVCIRLFRGVGKSCLNGFLIKKHLLANGKKLEARVQGSEKQGGSWFVTAEWVDEKADKTYIFKSRSLSSDPKYVLPDYVTVIFDPNSMDKYYMDTSFNGKDKAKF